MGPGFCAAPKKTERLCLTGGDKARCEAMVYVKLDGLWVIFANKLLELYFISVYDELKSYLPAGLALPLFEPICFL